MDQERDILLLQLKNLELQAEVAKLRAENEALVESKFPDDVLLTVVDPQVLPKCLAEEHTVLPIEDGYFVVCNVGGPEWEPTPEQLDGVVEAVTTGFDEVMPEAKIVVLGVRYDVKVTVMKAKRAGAPVAT